MPFVSAADLFDRYHLAAYRFFHRMTRRPDVAQDLTQELFLRVVRDLGRYRPMDREAAWLFRIARRVLADHQRSRRGADDPSLAEVEDIGTKAGQLLAFGLAEAIDLLSPADRQMLLLREVVGLGYAEIADACETTTEAVRCRLYRARGQLRELLAGSREPFKKPITRESS
jgi:RNA polymerase sigma-70 factor (ECF subfamily)